MHLAAEVATLGLRTILISPQLGEVWERSYGTFSRDLTDGTLGPAVKRRFSNPLVQVDEGSPVALSEEYLRFDTNALQSLLFERCGRAGVRLLSGTVVRVDRSERSSHSDCLCRVAPGPGDPGFEERGARILASLVINATGGRFRGPDEPAHEPFLFQSAYGQWIEVTQHPFRTGEMSFMDYRPTGTDDPASFLYAMPEVENPDRSTTLFVQETVLVSEKPVPMPRLQARLKKRLDDMRLEATRVLGVERCLIPMGGTLPSHGCTMLPFGASAGLVHPATGYQIATAFSLSPPLARLISERISKGDRTVIDEGLEFMWPASRRRAYRFYELGAATLATLDSRVMREFIHEFFQLSGGRWQRFMAGSMEAGEIAETMWRIFARSPTSLQTQLIRGGSAVTSRLLAQRLS